MPQIKIHFFRPEGLPEGVIVGALLKQISALEAEGRTLMVSSTPFRLQDLKDEGRYLLGDMARIRMELIPVGMKLNGDARELNLDDDEGIGEKTCFIYDTLRNILVLQSNRIGVSARGLASYITGAVDLPLGLEFNPILTEGAYQRLKSLHTFNRVEVKVAGIDQPNVFENADSSSRELLQIKQRLQAPSISLAVSVGRQKTSLAQKAVCDMVETLREFVGGQTEVKQLSIKGTTDDGEPEIVDLVEERLSDIQEVEVNARRNASFENRAQALKNALARHEDTLAALFQGDGQ